MKSQSPDVLQFSKHIREDAEIGGNCSAVKNNSLLKYKFFIPVVIAITIFGYLISCNTTQDPVKKMEMLIVGQIKDSLYRSGLTLDSIRISRIDTITEKDLISRQTRYHDIRMRRLEELANMQLSHQFLSFSKYKFFVQTGDTANASRIQMEMTQQTRSASRFSDSAQLYKHIFDSLSSLVTVDSLRVNYYQVFYTQFVAGNNRSRRKDNLPVIIMPDYTIKNVEPTRDLVINPR